MFLISNRLYLNLYRTHVTLNPWFTIFPKKSVTALNIVNKKNSPLESLYKSGLFIV